MALVVLLTSALPLLLSGCGSLAGAVSGTLTASSSSISFGSVPVGHTANASISLTNGSGAAVQVSQVSVTGASFSLATQVPSSITVPAGGSYSIDVAFNPSAQGAAAGTLTVSSNASNTGTTTVDLTGTGSSPSSSQAPTPAAMLTPAPGSVLPGASVTFNWSAGNGVTAYQLWLGTQGAGSSNLGQYSQAAASGNTVSQSVSGLPLNGQTIFARLLSQIAGSWQIADYTYTEAGSAPTNNATLAGLTCASQSMTGTGSDTCTVSLDQAAPSGGATVALASSNAALTLPASVAIPAGSATATFSASAKSVTSAQSVTVTATFNGAARNYTVQLNPPQAAGGSAALTLSAASLSFGTVNLNTPVTRTLTLTSSGTAPLTISAAALSGSGFTASGASFPVTLNPGSSATVQIQFDPTTAGAATGSLLISSDSSTGSTATVSLSGTGQATSGVLSALSCSSASLNGSQADVCTVSLSAPAAGSGLSVALASSSSSVKVPAAVTIPSGSRTAVFTVSASSVTTQQTAVLTATAGTATKTYSLQLNAAAPALSVSTTSLPFGDVTINSSSSQTLILTSSGTAALTINTANVTGAGFSITGASFPLTLNSGRSAALRITFAPTRAGAVTGTLTLSTNVPSGGTTSIALSGTGQSSAGSLSGLSCATNTLTGTATDACTVTLSAAAPTGGLTVNLSSSSTSVGVPAAALVPAGATSAVFTASASPVDKTQSVTLSAAAGGVTKTYGLQLNAATAGLTLSSNSISFGNVNLNTPTTQTVTLTSSGTAALTINGAAVSGAGFSVAGAGFPLTLNPGQAATLRITFDPATAGAVTGSIVISSNASSGGTATIALSGTGNAAAGSLSAIACTNSTITGAGNDACSVTLTAAAGSGGLTISLASSNKAVTLPASVSVASGATSAAFTATVAAVSSAQTAAITASAGGISKSITLQLNVGGPALTVSTSTIAFGSVDLNTPSTQSITLTSSGTAALTVNAAAISGAGFTMSGVSAPVTLNPGQTLTIDVQFNPTTTGAVTGTIVLTSNAAAGGTVTIALSGTGTSASHSVDLSWTAPASSSDPVAGYNIYREVSGGTSYQRINSSPSTGATYTDTTVQSGQTYNYEVTSVDANGNESAPSNVYIAVIP